MYDPWKELIAFYQTFQDAVVKYQRTMEYFDVEPEFLMAPEGREPYDLAGRYDVKGLAFVTEDGIRLIQDINFSLKEGEHLALVGFSEAAKAPWPNAWVNSTSTPAATC